ncbi:4-carboxymuconolactone decarboxylase [Colletotrichum gloeosporioides]|uniref:4-carboxymuconolactone decarboxylase n=1 Tax=Colletotrichum gloeosporioides TaxID=474922 RepID=A0A8H4FQV8_COLGL|nr:4-carboxymuconolactone decarboxylase [Colletotrichum gloeosporioides]KAF3809854.1 4-carboxymuconolactone decarboxylase [Colletotrichum gloeosporioides]
MENLTEKQLLGLKMMNEFFGEDLFNELREASRDDFPSKVGSEYIAETCFSSYARPGLTFQQRSLMNLGMLIALNRGPELRIHIKAALNNGLSEEQITEACRHAMVYCGVPAGRDALSVASEIFNEKKTSKRMEKAKLT